VLVGYVSDENYVALADVIAAAFASARRSHAGKTPGQSRIFVNSLSVNPAKFNPLSHIPAQSRLVQTLLKGR
jgi:hypothetical protein